MKRKKIALIGAGQIGGILALLCGMRNLGDVVLFDIKEGLPQGKALDLSHLAPVFGLDFKIKGTNDITDIQDADICVVTSGLPRTPGMSRDDLVNTNAEIIKFIAKDIKTHAPESFVIVITNPLDAMVYLMQKETGFSPSKVVGMAGVLDTARYQAFLAEELNVSVSNINACVLGGHGDSMVPVRSYTNVAGVGIESHIKPERLSEIEDRVRNAGGEVVALLKTGSAFFSPAASAVSMIEAYLFDQKKILPAAGYLDGEYGVSGLYLGVPLVIGANGVEKIIEIKLSESEKAELDKSIDGVKGLLKILGY